MVLGLHYSSEFHFIFKPNAHQVLQYFSAKMKFIIKKKHCDSTFSAHETYELKTHLSGPKYAKTHVRQSGI